ncbi:hypothetical protein NDU88_002068 [Pleurodeles waltl]|uniref:Uncharacterized protein n=1 Tax=Pleurodeles waltl TaxID=8319 RepID=A0AAV7TKY0_PLEWA|nr:hypothetical protein NDU88_002068 [Pleurodeles waltl]
MQEQQPRAEQERKRKTRPRERMGTAEGARRADPDPSAFPSAGEEPGKDEPRLTDLRGKGAERSPGSTPHTFYGDFYPTQGPK